MNEQVQPGLFIGIDWADKKHDCYVIDRNGITFHQEFKQSPEDIETWIGEMLKRADGKPIARAIITATRDVLEKLTLLGKDLAVYSLETVKMFHEDARRSGYKL